FIPQSRQKLLDDAAVRLHNDGMKSLATVLFGMQLPTFLVSALGMYFYDYSLYSMGAVMGLGAVLGFRNLQRSWQKSVGEFKQEAKEEARKAIAQCEHSIYKRWEAKVIEGQNSISQQIGILGDLKSETN